MPRDADGAPEAPLTNPVTEEINELFNALRRRKICVPEAEIFRGALGSAYLPALRAFLLDVTTCPPEVLVYAKQRLAMPEVPVQNYLDQLTPDPVVMEERRQRATLPRMGFSPWRGEHSFAPVKSS